MRYIGLHKQQARNNFRSVVLLCLFPCLVILLTLLFSSLMTSVTSSGFGNATWEKTKPMFWSIAPLALTGVAIWFLIAYFANTAIIRKATGARPLERRENMRVYNMVENLCMSQGMTMPKVNVIENSSLNAFASGINDKTYTVSLTRGIINHLNNDELEGVIAHELAHIRNRDVRLLIVSIVFVGIFAVLAQLAFRSLLYAPRINRRSNGKGGAIVMIVIILIALFVAAIGYFFATLMRFAISRKREYLADAAAAEMTRNPMALASALRKISRNPNIASVTRDDIAQLFIEHPRPKNNFFSAFLGLFATHPPIKKRITILEQF